MELSRRGRAVAGCGLALAVAAPLLARPALLGAAAAVGALLVGVAVGFVRRLGAERDALAVTIEIDPDEALVDQTSTIRVRAERPAATLPMRVALPLPGAIAASTGALTVHLDGHEAASYATPVDWSVAGTYSVGPPRVVATDPLGLFVASFEADAEREVRVQPREPGIVHLGRGGERVAAAFGEHSDGHAGSGIEAATLQRYEPGAQVSRIDWKATARLDEVYVVDPETETDRQTVLLLDHRASTNVGSGSETALAYLRNAALAVLGSARDLGDPVGCFAVGDRGVTVAEQPAVGSSQYAAIEQAVRSLRPTAEDQPAGHETVDGDEAGPDARESAGDSTPVEPDARFGATVARRIDGDDDAFAGALAPFFEDETQYLHRIADDPLFAAARTFLPSVRGSLWTVVLTDDSRRGELRETVKVARRTNDRVLVVLAPRVLFEQDGLTDPDRAYDRYREFESFRRDLASMDRVEALELAPGERVDAVIAAGGEPA